MLPPVTSALLFAVTLVLHHLLARTCLLLSDNVTRATLVLNAYRHVFLDEFPRNINTSSFRDVLLQPNNVTLQIRPLSAVQPFCL